MYRAIIQFYFYLFVCINITILLLLGPERIPVYPVNYPLNCTSGSNSLHPDTRLILCMRKNEHMQTEHVLIIVVVINMCNRQALKFYDS